MIDFDTAIDRLMKANSIPRGQAVQMIHDDYQAGGEASKLIQDIGPHMFDERAKSIFARAGAGIAEGVFGPGDAAVKGAERLFDATDVASEPGISDIATHAARSSTEQTPYAEGTGEVVGSAVPFSVLAEGAGAIPGLGGKTLLPRAGRNLLAGGALERVQTGQNTVLGAVASVAVPEAAGLAADWISKGVRTIFGRDASPEDVITKGNQTTDTPPTTTGDSSIISSTAAPPEPVDATGEPGSHVGTVNLRTGQPFQGDKTILLKSNRGRLLVNPDHPRAGSGTPATVSIEKPMVLNVHDEPYRDALALVSQDKPEILDAYDQHPNQEDFAHEVLGRFAKNKGYDSVVLRAGDPRNDVILDYKDFKTKPIEGLKPGVSAKITKGEPPQSIFARAVSEDEAPLERNVSKISIADVRPVHEQHGFTSQGEMEAGIRASQLESFEMWAAHKKTYNMPLPPIVTSLEGAMGQAEPILESEFALQRPDIHAAMKAAANRYPGIVGKLAAIGERHLPENQNALAITQRFDSDGALHLMLNSDFAPDTAAGQRVMKRMGFRPDQGKEYVATTLEHELTHVAQYHIDRLGLNRTFSAGTMGRGADVSAVESQAEDRAQKLQRFFEQHQALQDKVAGIPDEIKQKVFLTEADKARQVAKTVVSRKYNKLAGEPSVRVWARETPKLEPDDMDAFDSDSRKLTDSQFDPNKYIDPYIKQITALQIKYGLKPLSSFRNPLRVTDDPLWSWFIGKTWNTLTEKEIAIRKSLKTASKILKEYGATDKNYDSLFGAVEGLRRGPDGKLTQTIADLDPKTARAAVRWREHVSDPAYEHNYGIDRKAPAILAQHGLQESSKQWWRLKYLQEGLTSKVKNPTMMEVAAAKKLDGMLNFDESNDLSGSFKDGYMPHDPIANERSEIEDQIKQLTSLGVKRPEDVAMLQQRIQRLNEIEADLARQRQRGLSKRDTLPRRHFSGAINVRDNPLAAEVLVDKNIPHIAGRYINNLYTKRSFDQILHAYSKVAPNLEPSVRGYGVDYLNNLRGVRGYREDIQIVNFVNRLQANTDKHISVNDVRDITAKFMGLNNYLKLYAGFVRFPIIQASHVGLTSMVVDPEASARGLAYFTANPRRAIQRAIAAGVIDNDPEFLRALDESVPTSRNKLSQALTFTSKYADYFRKAVTYHGFRLQYDIPGYQPNLKIARSFIKDMPGRSRIASANDYGKAMTDRLQFRVHSEGKPQAFVGGAGRRLWGQFKQWPINIGGLYADILKSGDKKMIARMGGALLFFGGLNLGTGDILFNQVRSELLKYGIILPKETGAQMIANQMGIGETLSNINILTLDNPIGLPRSIEDLPSYIAGPTFGGMYDLAKQLSTGDEASNTKAVIGAISPPLRAGIDAYEEFKRGGIFTPEGRTVAMQSHSQMVIRGLDLSPSVKSQRYEFRNDIETALEAGQFETSQKLFDEARKKGIIFGRRDVDAIKAKVKMETRRRQMNAQDPERLLQ